MERLKSKAIFLDRDGTINIDYGYVYKIDDLELIEGVQEALNIFYNAGYLLIVISNQSGVARGYYSMEECSSFNAALSDKVEKGGAKITDFFICPHIDEDNCLCRKPKSYMIEEAIERYNIDRGYSYMFGDKASDIEAGEGAGVKSFLITEEHSLLYYANFLRNKSYGFR